MTTDERIMLFGRETGYAGMVLETFALNAIVKAVLCPATISVARARAARHPQHS